MNAVRHQRRRNRFTADRFDELDAGFELARIERLENTSCSVDVSKTGRNVPGLAGSSR